MRNMWKKIGFVVLSVLCMLCGSACDFSDPFSKEDVNTKPHKQHTYEENWNYNETHHWREATCGCDKKADLKEHKTVNGICSVCDAIVEGTEGIVYQISKDGQYAEVVDYQGTETKVQISDFYQGKFVCVIGENAFIESKITEIKFPNSLVSIEQNAFAMCRSLTSVIIPDSVKSIEHSAFTYCSNLTNAVLSNSVTILNGCLFGYTNLTNVTIGDSVTILYEKVFTYCNLTSVTIPTTVVSISEWAFGFNENLTTVYYEGTMEQWRRVGKHEDWATGSPLEKIICTDGEIIM